MNADGSAPTNLTNSPSLDGGPDWSPDGQKLAFASDRVGGREIYVTNADGSGQTSLTFNASAVDPARSPDGTKIAFDSSRSGNREIYVMNADGSNQTPITNDPAPESQPSWQPLVPVPGYPRPKGATPMFVSLVPAYLKCGGTQSGACRPACRG